MNKLNSSVLDRISENNNEYRAKLRSLNNQIEEKVTSLVGELVTLSNYVIDFSKTINASKEERLTRKENKLEQRRDEVEEKLAVTNKNIESNIEKENKLSQRKIELNAKELELNSKLSETEVIFLNMKPLIKGLNNIKDSEEKGGNYNE